MSRTRAQAFNEWLRLYTADPEQFAREFEVVVQFLAQQKAGEEPTYGESCDAFLAKLEAAE